MVATGSPQGLCCSSSPFDRVCVDEAQHDRMRQGYSQVAPVDKGAMSTGKKILIGSGVAIAVLAISSIAVYQSHKGVVTVQTGKAGRQDLASIVSASGEIKPKTYVNIGANAFGKITRLYVKEGDRVKKGQLLAQLENVQSSADVNATQASVEAAETDSVAADAALNTSAADLNRAQSDFERAQLDWTRAQGLYKESLIAKSEFDSQKAAWQTAQAGLAQAQARVAQAKAQKDSADRHITQNRANLTHAADVLQKTTYAAPYDGMITNLPVREGETVVIGIQNSPGSTLMTLADMSVITAEVKVDETDIVNVQPGPTRRGQHRRDSQEDFQSGRDGNRRQRHRALDRCVHLAANFGQPGSERFQGRSHPARPAGESAARALRHRQDHHRHAQQRPDHSHSGADRSLAGRFEGRQRRKRIGPGRCAATSIQPAQR